MASWSIAVSGFPVLPCFPPRLRFPDALPESLAPAPVAEAGGGSPDIWRMLCRIKSTSVCCEWRFKIESSVLASYVRPNLLASAYSCCMKIPAGEGCPLVLCEGAEAIGGGGGGCCCCCCCCFACCCCCGGRGGGGGGTVGLLASGSPCTSTVREPVSETGSSIFMPACLFFSRSACLIADSASSSIPSSSSALQMTSLLVTIPSIGTRSTARRDCNSEWRMLLKDTSARWQLDSAVDFASCSSGGRALCTSCVRQRVNVARPLMRLIRSGAGRDSKLLG